MSNNTQNSTKSVKCPISRSVSGRPPQSTMFAKYDIYKTLCSSTLRDIPDIEEEEEEEYNEEENVNDKINEKENDDNQTNEEEEDDIDITATLTPEMIAKIHAKMQKHKQ